VQSGLAGANWLSPLVSRARAFAQVRNSCRARASSLAAESLPEDASPTTCARCTGPADFDAGHCRLNLAVLFGADWAERLRLAYEAEAGRAIDPWWDLYALTAYSDEWRRFIPVQIAGRASVDTAGMTSRVEDLLEATLGRL
jgi:hypothetical protein